MSILWPSYYHDHSMRPVELPRIEPPLAGEPGHARIDRGTLRAGTLARGLPSFAGPALFLHGDDDPLPASASVESAALIADAGVETIEDAGTIRGWSARARSGPLSNVSSRSRPGSPGPFVRLTGRGRRLPWPRR